MSSTTEPLPTTTTTHPPTALTQGFKPEKLCHLAPPLLHTHVPKTWGVLCRRTSRLPTLPTVGQPCPLHGHLGLSAGLRPGGVDNNGRFVFILLPWLVFTPQLGCSRLHSSLVRGRGCVQKNQLQGECKGLTSNLSFRKHRMISKNSHLLSPFSSLHWSWLRCLSGPGPQAVPLLEKTHP